jgi:peptidoglycan/LPS O-acetylase OafA/YrhL
VTSRSGAAEHKLLGIELLRILSSVAVLVFHYKHFAFTGTELVDFDAARQPFYRALELFYVDGFYGVQVFWCISGFIFFWKYGRDIAESRISGYVFFVLRLSRLYPLHFATLLFVAAAQMIYFARAGSWFIYPYNDAYHFVLQLFMASNWGLQSGDSFNGPIWSISVEVLVYAFFFLSLRFISGRVWFLAAVCAAAVAVQMTKLSLHPFFPCVMYFYAGCLTAVAYERIKRDPRLTRMAVAGAALLTIGLVILALLVEIKAKYFLMVFTPSIILLSVECIPATPWTERILVPAGNMTYASYLLHVPIQISTVLICAAAGIAIPVFSAWFLPAFIAFTLLISHWTYAGFEMPMQRLIRRAMKQRRPAAAAVRSEAKT